MTSRASPRSGDSVLRVEGSLQFGNDFTILRSGIQELLDQGKGDIALELSRVERVDSSGIGELVHAFKRVAAAGGRLFVLNPPAKVEMLFQVAGLAKSLRRAPVQGRKTPRPPLGASQVSQLLIRSIGPGPSPSSKASTWRPYLGRLMWS